MLTIRAVQLPADEQALLELDTSFTTDRIYRVEATDLTFTLHEERVQPFRKSFSLADELGSDRLWDAGFVAEDGATIVGFAAARVENWNRRLAIWHVYVAPAYRGAGLGRRLLDTLEAYARANQARCLWLETSNLNYPAIQFYRRAGFHLCGLDLTLYDPSGAATGETAIFMARPMS
jgi:ribosomal protein S18 acetylase RimI-like enzyme